MFVAEAIREFDEYLDTSPSASEDDAPTISSQKVPSAKTDAESSDESLAFVDGRTDITLGAKTSPVRSTFLSFCLHHHFFPFFF